ncbi:hypothetical protein CDB402_1935 [Corynebacterium diphtheriae INCA 402]|nr:hypothetical protein CDB402_1935 [Corynebacterium diphtheriae INCA 402]
MICKRTFGQLAGTAIVDLDIAFCIYGTSNSSRFIAARKQSDQWGHDVAGR